MALRLKTLLQPDSAVQGAVSLRDDACPESGVAGLHRGMLGHVRTYSDMLGHVGTQDFPNHHNLHPKIATESQDISKIKSPHPNGNDWFIHAAAQAYGFLELFSGRGWCTKLMKVNGIPSANFDVEYGSPMEGKQDAMNLLSDSGFGFLGCKFVSISFLSSYLLKLIYNRSHFIFTPHM